MGNYTPEKLKSLSSSLERYSPATLRKDEWVIAMYEKFCLYLETEPWPIQAALCGNFLVFLRQEVKLAHSTISSVIVPGLKRVNKVKTGKTYFFIKQKILIFL
jgi:hypothetical protein